MNHELPAALRAHANGLYSLEAAAELIICHRTWLHRSDFTAYITTGSSITGDTALASVDWPAAITALDTGGLPCSGSEQRILRLAASLAEAYPSAFTTPSPDSTTTTSTWSRPPYSTHPGADHQPSQDHDL